MADKPLITAEELHATLSYDEDMGAFTWNRRPVSSPKDERWNRRCAGKPVGTIDPSGYIRIAVKRRTFLAHRLAWFYVTGRWPLKQIDHVNGDRSDNRFSNLREADFHENGQNPRLSRRNSSGFTGVHVNGTRYRAKIVVNRRQIHLGYADTAEEAFSLYERAKKELHTFNPKLRASLRE